MRIKSILFTLMIVSSFCIWNTQRSFAEEKEDKGLTAVINALSAAKVSLADGIRQATKGTEMPISAKYELDEKGKLSLSVYTAEKGLSVESANNVFHELSASSDSTPWKPESEVIKDQGDLKDAKEQSAVLSKAKVSLADIAQKAAQENNGTVISVIPQANHNNIEVKIVQNGKINEHHYDITSGNEVKMEGKDTDEGKDNDRDKY